MFDPIKSAWLLLVNLLGFDGACGVIYIGLPVLVWVAGVLSFRLIKEWAYEKE